jgi:hypothetical protein
MPRHYLYEIHCAIKQRCYNPKNKGFDNYGRRGIRLHRPWHDVNTFIKEVLAEIGPRPEIGDWTLDRIDNEGHYAPGNLRWATRAEQSLNSRTTAKITVDGERTSLYRGLVKLGLTHSQAMGTTRWLNRYGHTLEHSLLMWDVDMSRISAYEPAQLRVSFSKQPRRAAG